MSVLMMVIKCFKEYLKIYIFKNKKHIGRLPFLMSNSTKTSREVLIFSNVQFFQSHREFKTPNTFKMGNEASIIWLLVVKTTLNCSI